MGKLQRLLVALPLIAACVGCDQVSKVWAVENLATSPERVPYEWLGGAVRILYAENPGAFLGLGAGLPDTLRAILLVGVAMALLVVIGVALLRARWISGTALVAVTLLFAGGLGNIIDRLLRDGLVVDFVNLGLGPVRTGIFNLADVQLMAGAALIAWIGFRGRLFGEEAVGR